MDFGSEFGAVQSGRAFRNPGISLCHVAFRSAALLVYLFGGMFSSSFIGVFVAVVLLLSIDFWIPLNRRYEVISMDRFLMVLFAQSDNSRIPLSIPLHIPILPLKIFKLVMHYIYIYYNVLV